ERLRTEQRRVALARIAREHAVAQREGLFVPARPREHAGETYAAVVVPGCQTYVNSEQRSRLLQVVAPGEQRRNAKHCPRRGGVVAEHRPIAVECVVEPARSPCLIGGREDFAHPWLA